MNNNYKNSRWGSGSSSSGNGSNGNGVSSSSSRKVKEQAVESHTVVRCRGFHIFWTIGSQMGVMLASRTDRALPSREIFWYSFLLEAE
jgi:hypothetical protein